MKYSVTHLRSKHNTDMSQERKNAPIGIEAVMSLL